MYCTSYIAIDFVNFFYGMDWQPHLTRSLIVCMDHSMYPMCSFSAHMCRFSGDKKYWMFSNSFSPWKSVIVKPLSCYLDLTCFRPDRISYFPLLFHACIDLKYISVIVFVCVFLLPPVCAVCLNNYIVVFQHHTGTALDLGFVRQLHLL